MPSPFARLIGQEVHSRSAKDTIVRMRADQRLEGRPGFLHGGAIATLFELAVADHFFDPQADRVESRPRLIGQFIEYLRNGLISETWVRTSITRRGSRLINVAGEAWQADRAKPIAIARLIYEVPRQQD